jgi:hypothetical protein
MHYQNKPGHAPLACINRLHWRVRKINRLLGTLNNLQNSTKMLMDKKNIQKSEGKRGGNAYSIHKQTQEQRRVVCYTMVDEQRDSCV